MLVAPALARQTPPPFAGRVIDERSSAPIAGASVTIGGIPGSVRTDENGKFTFEPSPTPPFQVVVVLAAGQVAKPVLITTIDTEATIKVNALADESVNVVGAAPSIDAAPGAATTLLSNLQITRRAPENLMQVLETVPGINQVSEGHASVPAIRGWREDAFCSSSTARASRRSAGSGRAQRSSIRQSSRASMWRVGRGRSRTGPTRWAA